VTGTYDAQDRLMTYGNESFTYTANGELASQTVGSKTATYSYDVFGNLTAVNLPNGTAISYIVDTKNRRVGKHVNGALAAGYLYDGNRIVAQLNGSNAIVSQFIYGSRSPDYMIQGGITYRIFSDQLGSPRLIVNAGTGAIAEEIDYDEFGNVINDTNPGFQPFGFAGGLYDQDTKLVRFGARDYNPSTGRWTAKDPILFGGGDTNLYDYGLDDPVNMRDPAGLEGSSCVCEQNNSPDDERAKEALKDLGEDVIEDIPILGQAYHYAKRGWALLVLSKWVCDYVQFINPPEGAGTPGPNEFPPPPPPVNTGPPSAGTPDAGVR
jgi:RHS repeat-associated protein